MRIAVILIFLVILTSCEPFMEKWYYIKVTNLSSRYIMVTAGYGRYKMNSYPDTIFPDEKPSLLSVDPTKSVDLRSSFPWENVIEEMPLDTLSIYFFDADTIEKYNWSFIKDRNLVLKRLDLSIQDLRDRNWQINFQ